MTTAIILGLLGAILENIILFMAGRLLIHNKQFIAYLGLGSQSSYEGTGQNTGSGLIDNILKTIGQVVQVVALIRIVTQIAATATVLN